MPDIHIRLHKDILWLVLDKQPLNPLTTEMLTQLTYALQRAIRDQPRLVVLTGTGERAFCVGVELPDETEMQRAALLQVAKETDEGFRTLHKQKIPTVALVKGSAFRAGCELAILCDTIIARDDAEFRIPSINGKIFPGSLSVCLPELVGQETATRLAQSGETLSARQAFQLGLVHQVLPKRHFLSDSEELLVMLATVGSAV
jgi:enoyl-CoA hydratase/carnithine racemase